MAALIGCSRVKSEWPQQPDDADTGTAHQSRAMQGNTFTVHTAAGVNPPLHPCSWLSQPRPTPVWSPGEMLSPPSSPHTRQTPHGSPAPTNFALRFIGSARCRGCRAIRSQTECVTRSWGEGGLCCSLQTASVQSCLPAVATQRSSKALAGMYKAIRQAWKGLAMDTALVSSKACHFTSCLISY